MKRTLQILVLCAFLLAFSACVKPEFELAEAVIEFENVAFGLELAETPEEQAKGLMHYKYLPLGQGMLFIFENTAHRQFWMKNTLIPLDMIYLDENFKVVEVKQNIPPCEVDPCELYLSKPAMYVLEVNAGMAEKYGIKTGSEASFSKNR